MSMLKLAALVVLICVTSLSVAGAQTAGPGNRKHIPLSVKPLDLRRAPTTAELMSAGQLGGALYPTHDRTEGASGDAMNLSFGAAMAKWNRHEYRKAAQLLKQHIKDYPQSPWVSEAALHLGCDAQYNGRYVEAQKHFEQVLQENQGKDHTGAKALTDKARLRLGVLKAFQNNLPEARDAFKELYKNAGDWRERTYAGHWIQRINRMKRSGKTALNCGNQALAALLERDGRGTEAGAVLDTAPSSDKGQSVRELEESSARHGYPLVARSFGTARADALAAPAIVHLPAANAGDSGHYWLFEGKEDDGLKFFDPQAGKHFVQTPAEFSEQWDGIALVKADAASGNPLDKDTAGSVFGGCCGVPRAEEDLGCPDGKCKKGPSMNGAAPYGAPAWTVNMVNMNFYMTDVPLWYRGPIGPAVEIQLSYNSQSAIATNEPFGNKWQFNYSSYLVVDTANEVTIFMPDGRRDVYRPNNILNPAAGYQKPYGVFNTLTYLGQNQFELTLPEGLVYRYSLPAGTLSEQTFLTEIRDTYNQKLTFGYNSNVQLTSITDASGRISNIAYDTNGLAFRVTDPFGRHADFAYDTNRNLIGITDMGGYTSSFTYDANVLLTGITNGGGAWQVYIEPADGIDNGMVKYPDPGAEMWENYRTTITNPQGGKEEYYYNGYYGSGWYKSPNHYGTGIETLAYDYTKNTTTATGGNGELRSVLSPEGVSISFNYDTNGRILSETDGHGDMTAYTYNTMGRVASKTLPNLQSTSMSYAANGVDITGISNGLGTIAIGYNLQRDITSVRDRMGATTSITYNAYGQPATVTDALPMTTTYTYDGNHFLTQQSRNGVAIKSYTYDAMGRVRTVTDATGTTLTFDYNSLDDVTKITWPDGKFVSLTYSTQFPHLVTSQTDRGGRTATMVYDSLQRLTQHTNSEGGVTRFNYDKDSRLTLLTSANGGVTRYFYNNDGQLKIKQEADGARTAYEYDSGGLLKTLTNGRSTQASYLYDTNDNLLSITYSDGVTPAVSFQYDAYDRLTAMNDGLGAHLYGYDANSRLVSIDGPLTNDTITYSYDGEGRHTGVSIPGGLATTNTYDALNRLTAVANGAGTFSYGYTGASPRAVSLTRPNGSVTAFLYDSLARLTSVTNRKADTTLISSYAYTTDVATDLRGVETTTGGTDVLFGAASQTGYSYDLANKLLSATPSVTFSHDADGNMTGGVTPEGYPFTAVYNANNQLISLQYTDGAASVRRFVYTYNGQGYLEALTKYVNGVAAEQLTYVRDRSQVYQERSSVAGTSEYTWGLDYGGGTGGLLGLRRGAAVYSYLYDGKGNVTGTLDSGQAVASGYSYDPFGVLLNKSGSLAQPFRFATKSYDEQTGLSYFGYRHYAPGLGRWLTRDPLGPRGGVNLYGFAGNNPVNRFDPNGLAYFAFRSLDQPSIINTDGNAVADFFDLETAHENIFFEDGQGGDMGFFNDGVHPDYGTDPGRYSRKSEYYEDDLLREAIKKTKVGKYDVFTNNCQQWATRVKKEYNKLKSERDWQRRIQSLMDAVLFFTIGPRGGGFF